MHLAIVGAGALARVYGARLSLRARADVTLVVRPGRCEDQRPLRIERIDGDREVDTWTDPRLASVIPEGTDVVLVTVRGDQLDASLDALLDTTGALIVILTPMMPDDSSRLTARYGTRLRAAMVGVVAYVNDAGSCRYWLPRSATTLIDSTSGFSPALRELASALDAAGIETRLEPHVGDSNLATTVAIVPAAMGIDAAGTLDALLGDRELLDLTLGAIKEGLTLGGRIGQGASWLGVLKPFIGPRMLRIGLSLGRKSSPEAFAYVEKHFGRKLHAQNVRMGEAVIELAKIRGTPHASIIGLLERLKET